MTEHRYKIVDEVVHFPKYFIPEKVEDIYSAKDGVPVKYVCTSEIPNRDMKLHDIFYRETPHPEFGNRYFGLSVDDRRSTLKSEVGSISYICNADSIDNQEFGVIWDYLLQAYKYSRYRHDYVTNGSDLGQSIDGGRAYMRGNGFQIFRLKDGKFTKEK